MSGVSSYWDVMANSKVYIFLGSPVFFLESDDESSGEWDGNEKLER